MSARLVLRPIDEQKRAGRLERSVMRVWPGVTAQSCERASQYAFSYSGAGVEHCIALHDMERLEGETVVDGLPPSRLKDLRGTLTFLPSGCAVSGWTRNAAGPSKVTAVYFDPASMSDELGMHYAGLSLRPLLHFRHAGLAGALRRIDAMLGEEEGDLTDIMLEALCLHVAVLIGRVQADARRPAARPESVDLAPVARARAYILDNLAARISLDELAGVAGLSRFHFLRRFRAQTGTTPYKFIIRERLERAKAMLETTPLGIGEIGRAVGFSNSTQFVRMFHKVTGMTPGQFREQRVGRGP